MRLILAMVLVGLVALPLNVSAQDAGTTARSGASGPGRPDLSGERYGYGTPRSQKPRRTAGMDTLELMELCVKRARIGVVTTAGAFVVGTVLMGVGYAGCPISEPRCEDWAFPMFVTGTTLVVGGIFGLITSGGIMAHRKRKLRKHKRELRESPYTHYGTPRRAQWDLAQSRLVF